MEKFYVGHTENGRIQIFLSTPKDATPEATGYESVEGPFDSEEEAREAAGEDCMD